MGAAPPENSAWAVKLKVRADTMVAVAMRGCEGTSGETFVAEPRSKCEPVGAVMNM